MSHQLSPLSLAVFDLDGTLVELEIEHFIDHATSHLAQMGLPVHSREKIHHLLRMHKHDELFPVEVREEASREYWRRYDVRSMPSPRLIEGTLATLEEMVARGFELAIATARTVHAEELREVLRPTGILKHVEVLSTWYQTGWNEKAAQLKGLCQEHAIHPSTALMVGDSCDDIRSSHVAEFGLNIALRSGMHVEELLAQERPHYVVDSVREVPKTVDLFYETRERQKIK